jgi:hypothetical protein
MESTAERISIPASEESGEIRQSGVVSRTGRETTGPGDPDGGLPVRMNSHPRLGKQDRPPCYAVRGSVFLPCSSASSRPW